MDGETLVAPLESSGDVVPDDEDGSPETPPPGNRVDERKEPPAVIRDSDPLDAEPRPAKAEFDSSDLRAGLYDRRMEDLSIRFIG